MDERAISAEQIAVWKAMAGHFLDTETRQDIPFTALACVNAGHSVEEAHAVWLSEVSPVVGANLLDIAGEWAGWHEEWLVGAVSERARRRRARPCNGLLAKLSAGYRLDLNRRVWRSIERCMRVLLAAPSGQRQSLMQDLSVLARHYFDFAPSAETPDAAQLARLRELRITAFEVFEPATWGKEAAQARERVERALAR